VGKTSYGAVWEKSSPVCLLLCQPVATLSQFQCGMVDMCAVLSAVIVNTCANIYTI